MTGKNINKAAVLAISVPLIAGGVAAWIYFRELNHSFSVLRLAGPLANLLALVGLAGFVVMIALGTRLPWIERVFGLDRVYRMHKILGVAVLAMFIGHALLRTLSFSIQHANGWAWSFLFYFSMRNPALLLGHVAFYILVIVVPIAIWGRHRISFWLWKNSHLLVYPAVAVGFIHAMLEQGKHIAGISNLLLFIPIGAALIFLSIYRVISRLRLERLATWQVTGLVRETGDTTTLVLSRPEGPGPFANRRAGQFAIIRVRNGRRWSEPHPFTISAPPHSQDLHFTIKAAGRFTSSVPSLTPGTEILCEGPYGVFSVDFREKRDVVMISGGVGITPFLSLIRHAVRVSAETSIVLFCCNRSLDDIIAMEELNLAAEQIPLSVVHVLSKQPKDGLPSGSERVRFESGHISGEILARHVPSADASFYLCGPPSLQETVLRALKETLGVPPSRVKRELFFY